MSVYKDEKANTWKVYYRYTDWQGKSTKQQSEGSRRKEKLSLGNESRKLRLKQIWICLLKAL